MLEFLEPGSHTFDLAVRFFAAACLGAIIGIDRELLARPAGLRTHMMTALSASVFTVITLELHQQFLAINDRVAADPIRIIEAVTAGVAFLAAGAIIHSRGNVRGLTTGAGMWLAGAVGVACGSGRFELAVIAVGLAALILVILRPLERWLLQLANADDAGDDSSGKHK